ncbi:MAG: hypothetical protein ACRERU_20635 [Methylococcales bacterium]
MLTNLRESGSRLLKSYVLWGYGWQRRTHTDFGRRVVQWRHPHTGLWYREATAMRILTVDLMTTYNR